MGNAIDDSVGIGAFESCFDAADKFIKIQEENKLDVSKNKKYTEMKKLFDEAYYSLNHIFEKM